MITNEETIRKEIIEALVQRQQAEVKQLEQLISSIPIADLIVVKANIAKPTNEITCAGGVCSIGDWKPQRKTATSIEDTKSSSTCPCQRTIDIQPMSWQDSLSA